MDVRQALLFTLVSTLTLGIPTHTHAINCIKGKPCGKGCIALNKTCRIGTNPGSHDNTLRYDPGVQSGSIIRTTKHRLPTVHIITAASITTTEAPHSNRRSGHRYKQGQRVFVYETYDAWARISNMQPQEWLELKYLKKVKE